MRGLSREFINDLKCGVLSPLLEAVHGDRDLVLEIRNDYLNVYFRGHSLLRLEENGRCYPFSLHDKFRVEALCGLSSLSNQEDTKQFVEAIPEIKARILGLRKSANEIECEQMLIRANNCEPHLNTDYFIIDRQLVTEDGRGRFDLVGIFQPHRSWAHGGPLPLALLELKLGLNADIQTLHEQLGQYYESVSANLADIAEEAEVLLRQQLQLGLFRQPSGRLAALGRVSISRDINDVRFGIVLVDYHPESTLLGKAEEQLGKLHFRDQIDIFHVGFGLWQRRANGLCAAPLQ